MAYIGKQPVVGNFVKLDAITTSATTTFNLTNGGVAYSPQSPNHCIVSLNGVIQSPTSAYTISGSTIVFSDALTSSDTIDFILVLGDVLNIGTPSDATVGFSKITSNLITGATAETAIAGADSILIYDDSATALRKMTRTNFVAGVGGVNTPAFLVTTTLSNNTTGASTLFKFDSETIDTDNCFNNTAGNYRFTPNVAGKYFLYTQTLPYNVGPTYNLTDRQLYITKNGTTIARCTQLTSTGSTYAEEMNCSVIADANGSTDYFDVRYEISVSTSTLQHDGGACNFFGFKIIT